MISGSLGARRKIRLMRRCISIGVLAMFVGSTFFAFRYFFSHVLIVNTIVNENPEDSPKNVNGNRADVKVFGDPGPQEETILEAKAKSKETIRPHFKP